MPTQLVVAPVAKEADSAQPLIIAGCCLTMIAALVLGVGVPNHMVVRHIVQTLPLWPAVILGLRRSPAAGWVGFPLFIIWAALMTLIWLYLLGISHLLSGHFSAWEITMTILVGAACVIGIVVFVPLRSSLSAVKAAFVFLGFLILQVFCLRISFLPVIAHR